jgi:hypothetical protein
MERPNRLDIILRKMFDKQKMVLERSNNKLLREDILDMGYKPICLDVEKQPIQIFFKGREYIYWSYSTGNYITYGLKND